MKKSHQRSAKRQSSNRASHSVERKIRQQRTRTLLTESLESRRLMAADVSLSQGALHIEGSNASDQVEIRYANSSGSKVKVTVGNARPLVFSTRHVSNIRFDGNNGNDLFTNNTRIPSTAYGGRGNDRLVGGFGNDKLHGGSNNDVVAGRGGNDKLYGNSGNDTLDGGDGNDYLSGYTGHDTLKGGGGHDKLVGSNGNDKLYGGSGNDRLEGGNDHDYLRGDSGRDTITGGPGNDKLFGDNNNDNLYGNSGNDYIEGGHGNDYLSGYTGNDTLKGASGNDTLRGSSGNDSLNGDSGHDDIDGQAGNDYIHGGTGNDHLKGGSDHDRIFGSNGHDRLYGNGGNDLLEGGSGNDYLSGYTGNDTLKGGTGNDTLRGSSGNDRLYGNSGDDDLDGQAGNDFLSGYLGNDILKGGSDDDQIFGSGGNDRLYGNGGNDLLDGGAGNDYLSGYAGNDTLRGGSGNDELVGAVGDDALDGGDGTDVLNGGSGHDQYFHSLGSDRVIDSELNAHRHSQQQLANSVSQLVDRLSPEQREALRAEFLEARDADGFSLGGWVQGRVNAGKAFVSNLSASPAAGGLRYLGREAEDQLQNIGSLVTSTFQDLPADANRILRQLGTEFQNARTPEELGNALWTFVRDAYMFKSAHLTDLIVDVGSTIVGSVFGRALNQGEIDLAHRIFGNRIDVSSTRIVTGNWFPGGMYGGNVIFMNDNPLSTTRSKALFAHELMHLYQDQNVLMAGTVEATREAFTNISWDNSGQARIRQGRDVYALDIHSETHFADLRPEQQAVVVEQAFLTLDHNQYHANNFDHYNDKYFDGQASDFSQMEAFLLRRAQESRLF